MRTSKWSSPLQRFPAAAVLARTIELSLRYAREGLEGEGIAAAFIIGDLEELKPFMWQKLLNPSHGHDDEVLNVFNPKFTESLREQGNTDLKPR